MKTATEISTPTIATIEYNGLCASCSSATDCTFKRSAERAIMHCDEFSGYEIPGLLITEAEITAKPRLSFSEPTPSILSGLCVNCEERDGCTYPKSDGGVWRCEDYR
jgi:hypothetical protein